LICMVDVPEPGAAIVVGVKVTTTSDGIPDAVKVMAESNPLATVVVIVELPLVPQFRLSEAGDALREKLPVLGGPVLVVTVKETLVVSVTPPPVPVTVIG